MGPYDLSAEHQECAEVLAPQVGAGLAAASEEVVGHRALQKAARAAASARRVGCKKQSTPPPHFLFFKYNFIDFREKKRDR